ncbi:MAG TPA: SMP-30/gluconolactonase/LRE family protein [Candidatus Binataceae bacterium]|jgi:gluconolactonase|nr:SMP-30/gluconolactonase/LRE family protein [Candidatus Binataceae bacterium]
MQLETLAWGYGLIEGPRVDERNRLHFSDVPNGGVYRRSPDGTVETLIPRRRGVGGIALNATGGIVCSGRSLICWEEATRTSRDLFTEWEGRALRGLNDLTVDIQGSIYVGSLEFDALSADKPIPGNLFRVDPPNRVTLLWEGIQITNGMGFNPDGKLLYHCDSATGAVWAYDVTADRRLKDRRVFGRLPEGWPDGMAVDAEGGVWVAVVRFGEVVRFKADGTLDRRIKMPAQMVTSLAFGGADMMDLYVVTADNTEDAACKGTIFRMRSDVPGLPVPKARF